MAAIPQKHNISKNLLSSVISQAVQCKVHKVKNIHNSSYKYNSMNTMVGTMLNCSQLIFMMCHCLFCSNVYNYMYTSC